MRGVVQIKDICRHTLRACIPAEKEQNMNTLTEQFDSVYADVEDEVIEKQSQPKASIVTPTYHPMEAKPLSGYESIMRKHAAACEAGR